MTEVIKFNVQKRCYNKSGDEFIVGTIQNDSDFIMEVDDTYRRMKDYTTHVVKSKLRKAIVKAVIDAKVCSLESILNEDSTVENIHNPTLKVEYMDTKDVLVNKITVSISFIVSNKVKDETNK